VQGNRLKDAWRIWICPCMLWYAYASVLVFFFWTLELLIRDNDDGVYYLENMLVFAMAGGMLTACYFIMLQCEKVKQVRVRRRIRLAFAFFVVVYVIYALLMVCDLAKEVLGGNPGTV